MQGPVEDGKAHDSERQLRQGDLPVTPDRALEPPADGVAVLPTDWDESSAPINADLEDDLEDDPVREAVVAEDWPQLSP